MKTVGDSEGIEEDGIASNFRKTVGRVKDKEVMIIRLFEFDGGGFDFALAFADSLMDGGNTSFCG